MRGLIQLNVNILVMIHAQAGEALDDPFIILDTFLYNVLFYYVKITFSF